MISSDLRSLTASLKAHYDNGHLPPGFFNIFVDRLHDIAERVERIEGEPVPDAARGLLFDDEKVVSMVNRRPKPRPAQQGGVA